MMKKILTFVLLLVMLVSVVACDDGGVSAPVTDDAPSGGGLGAVGGEGDGDESTPEKSLSVPSTWLKVATYNVHRCEDVGSDPTKIAEFIKEYEIDIIGLNELDVNCNRSAGYNQPKVMCDWLTKNTGTQYYYAFAAALDGYHKAAIAKDGNAQYGNAIISKYPIESTRVVYVFGNNHANAYDPTKPSTQVHSGETQTYERRALLIAQLNVNGESLTVMATHWGLNFDERQNMVTTIKSEMSMISTPVVLMGDFNEIYTGTNITALSTHFRSTKTGLQPYTYSTTNPTKRIDYIYTTKELQSRESTVPNVTLSDHFPVIVKIGWY